MSQLTGVDHCTVYIVLRDGIPKIIFERHGIWSDFLFCSRGSLIFIASNSFDNFSSSEKRTNNESLAEIWVGMLKYYTETFQFDRQLVQGSLMLFINDNDNLN